MTAVVAAASPKAPDIDWAALSPLLALLGGACVVLLVGLLRSRFVREQVVPFLALASFGTAIGCVIWQWDTNASVIEDALRIDHLSLLITLIVCATGVVTVLLAWRDDAAASIAHGEFWSLMLTAAAGMMVLASSEDLVSAFVGLELLSLPLYILCASRMRRERSLESGLKYLIVGSVGSATLLYGFALLYGGTGTTNFAAIARGVVSSGLEGDPLFLTGVALTIVGLAFKTSLAPFHQWTPDVYEGAPTPVTAFMSVATKAAAFALILRLSATALLPAVDDWQPIWATIAVISIVVGNVGALGQSSLKRLLAYSSIAQAGYMVCAVVIATGDGVEALVYYLIAYMLANLTAFAVVIARERQTGRGDDISALRGLGASSPLLALAMTISMLSLAGIPATAGFIGKFNLIAALVSGDWTWLGIAIVIGSMISLAYYLPIAATMWRDEAAEPAAPELDERTGRPALAGGSPEADAPVTAGWEVTAAALLLGAATLFFGIVPQPLFDLVDGLLRTLNL